MFVGRASRLVVSMIALAALQGRAQTPNRIQSVTEYRTAVATIDSCPAFRDALQRLPTANGFMRAVARSPIAEKSDFETKEGYKERIKSKLVSILGDTTKVYVSAPVSKYWTTYLPEIGQEAINFHAWPGISENRLDLYLAASGVTTGSYTGVTALGARRRVEKRTQSMLTVGVLFPRGVVENTIYFPLSGSDAAALASGAGTLHVLGEIVGATTRMSGGSPTFANPLETRTTFDEVRLRPRCAFLTLNGHTLDAWSFDKW